MKAIRTTSIASFLAVALTYSMLGCPAATPQTLSQTASAIFTSVDAVLAITDPGFDETQLIAASNAAVAALNSWKPGADSTEVIQALTDFENIIKTITAIPQQDQQIIQVAVNGVQNIIAVVNAGTSTTASQATTVTPAAYKATFNTAVSAHPELGQAKF